MGRRRILIRDPAGPYVEGFGRAFYRPFTEATGIEIECVSGGVEPTDLIRGMVGTGQYKWDLALISQAAHLQLARENLLEPIGVSTPGIDAIPAGLKSQCFIGNDVYATVLVCRREAFTKRQKPGSWEDFWNVAAFEGRRALRRHPIDTIEQALLADGIAPAALYPCDIDRAFVSLARIRSHIDVWWPKAAQSQDILTRGVVDLCPTSSIRARAAIDAGADVEIVWTQNILSCEGWCILRGTPQADLCREFVAFVATAERQAAYVPFLCTGPTVPGALDLVDKTRARLLPTHPDNADRAVFSDPDFWSRAKDGVLARFDRWVSASEPS